MICTDSLSSLMAIRNLKQDHPLLPDIFDFYICMRHQHKYVMFYWVPSHVGIQGNELVDVLAKLSLNEAYTNIKIPYTDLVYYAKLHLRINKFRANFMQYTLNWVYGLTHPRSVEETNLFSVVSVLDIRT